MRYPLLIVSLILLSVIVRAEDESQAAASLSRLLAPLEALQGQFKQRIVDTKGEIIQESEGWFAMKRPGKFRWETLAPFDQILVSDQVTLWLYDPDLEQVTVRPFDPSMQQTPALLLSGEVNKISEHFRVQMASGQAQTTQALKQQSDNPVQTFSLQPKGENSLFEELDLSFVGGQLSEMAIHDSLGQITTISLQKLIANKPISDQQFTFKPPPGTDVLLND